MKLPSLLGAAVCCCLCMPALAQQRDFSNVEVKASKVAGNIYMLQGAGGNIGVSIGEDGVVIVDDDYAPMADKILAALKGITDKPLRFIINTHYHFDHAGGNPALQKSAPVIAHDNVRKRLQSGGEAGNGASIKLASPPAVPEALPIITFERDVTVHLNGEDIRALHFPNGHTDGDSVVFFPKSNVVHMGDDFVTYGFPFIDLQGGGSVSGMINACEGVIKQLPADVKIIPGHGPVSTVSDLKTYVTMLKETRAVVQKAVKAGKKLDQLKQEKILAPWQKYSGAFISADAYIETLYNDLTGKKNTATLPH